MQVNIIVNKNQFLVEFVNTFFFTFKSKFVFIYNFKIVYNFCGFYEFDQNYKNIKYKKRENVIIISFINKENI